MAEAAPTFGQILEWDRAGLVTLAGRDDGRRPGPPTSSPGLARP
jgi:hypothetical protein